MFGGSTGLLIYESSNYSKILMKSQYRYDQRQQGMDGIYLENNDLTPTYILSYVRGTNNIRLRRNTRNMVLARCGGYGSHRYRMSTVYCAGVMFHVTDVIRR